MWPFRRRPRPSPSPSDGTPPGPLADTPGPSPWYLRRPGLALPSARGPLTWRSAGDHGERSGKTLLVAPSGDALLILDFHCYVQPLGPPRFLVWHSEGEGADKRRSEVSAVRFRVLDADALAPIEDVDAALAHMQAAGRRSAIAAGEVASVAVPTSLDDGLNRLAFPEAMHEIDELLVLAHSTAGGVESNYDDQMRLQLWIIRPRDGTIDVIPQDWFNRGDYDFGYQWVTRVAREPGGRIVGEGIRIEAFALDDSGRWISQWLRTNPFDWRTPGHA